MGGSSSRPIGSSSEPAGIFYGGPARGGSAAPAASSETQQQIHDDELLARRMMIEEMTELAAAGGSSSSSAPRGGPVGLGRMSRPRTAHATCTNCGVSNEYQTREGVDTLTIACGSCGSQFQARSSPRGAPAAGGHMTLHICRRCGTMNQFPTPAPGSGAPRIQCGHCSAITTLRRSRHSAEERLAEHMLRGAAGNGAMGPLVHINLGGQRRLVPLALLLALMNEERGNSAQGSDIEALPTRKLGNNENLGEQNKCLICLEEFKDGDDVKTLPCLHFYHQKCVERWLRTDNSCPVCKTPIGHAR